MTEPHDARRAPRVEVHIERLVLDGFDLRAADAERLRAGLGTALADALRGRAVDAFDATADARRQTTVRLLSGAPPAATGSALGRAVARTLAPDSHARRR